MQASLLPSSLPTPVIVRCLAVNHQQHQQIFLWQDQSFSLPLEDPLPFPEGSLLNLWKERDQLGWELLYLPPQPLSVHGDALRWRKLGQSPSRMDMLRKRHQLLRSLRQYFDDQGFLEVQTPLRVFAPSPEPHFELMRCSDGYLVTSPEFQMKRLLVGGFEKIYQINSCFRGNEIGRWHNPEFTMLEWYRVGERWPRLCQDLQELVEAFPKELIVLDRRRSLQLEWERCTVQELVYRHWQIELSPEESVESLKEKLIHQGHQSWLEEQGLQKEDFVTVFGRLWDELESGLGWKAPCLVDQWPKPMASLAQLGSSGYAERVECYVHGMELANGFTELTNPTEQRQRFEQDLQERRSQGKEIPHLDELFLASLSEGMPPSCGMALGVERLLLWLLGAQVIDQIRCFSENEIF